MDRDRLLRLTTRLAPVVLALLAVVVLALANGPSFAMPSEEPSQASPLRSS